MSNELKLCPFCGSEAYDYDSADINLTFCSNDKCKANIELMTFDDWNTRPLEDALRAKLEVAKEAMGKVEFLSRGDGDYGGILPLIFNIIKNALSKMEDEK